MAAAGNASFTTTLSATTIDKWLDGPLLDQITKNNVIYYKIKEMGGIELLDGGQTILKPIMYEGNSTVKSHGDNDTIDVTQQAGMTCAQFNWKNITGALVISLPEQNKNSGTARMKNLYDTKLEQLENSFIQELATEMYSDGIGNSSQDITGFRAMVLATGTYAGISATTDTYWQSTVDSTSESWATAFAAGEMRTAMRATEKGFIRGGANLIITTAAGFNAYEATLTPTLRTLQNDKMVDAGFTNVYFERVPVVWDEACSTGYMYFLPFGKYVKLAVHKDRNFKRIGPTQAADQLSQITLVSWYGNLICTARKKCAVMSGKT